MTRAERDAQTLTEGATAFAVENDMTTRQFNAFGLALRAIQKRHPVSVDGILAVARRNQDARRQLFGYVEVAAQEIERKETAS